MADSSQHEDSEPRPRPAGSPECPLILVADDNADDVFLLREGLSSDTWSFDLVHALDGEEALKLLDSKDRMPDLIVLDYHLPRLTGEEVLTAFRQSNDSSKSVVVILSSVISERQRSELLQLGAHSIFEKPCDFKGFMELGTNLRSLISAR